MHECNCAKADKLGHIDSCNYATLQHEPDGQRVFRNKSIMVRIKIVSLDIFCPMNGTFAHRLGVSVASEEKLQETLAKCGVGL